MLKYHNYDIVFAEIPGEVTLAVNITGCPHRCAGCHSPHLREDTGRALDDSELSALLSRYGRSVTCVCFMGGDGDPYEVARLAATVRESYPHLRTGWYSGCDRLPDDALCRCFDYIKVGPYMEEAGSLTSPTTNQRLYRIAEGGAEDVTYLFRKR